MVGLAPLPGDAAIRADTNVTLAGLAILGVLLPWTVAAPGPSYAAVFWPGEDAIARLSQAGGAWRLLRVVSVRPVPILVVARVGHGRPPSALLLPLPSAPGCLFAATGSRSP